MSQWELTIAYLPRSLKHSNEQTEPDIFTFSSVMSSQRPCRAKRRHFCFRHFGEIKTPRDISQGHDGQKRKLRNVGFVRRLGWEAGIDELVRLTCWSQHEIWYTVERLRFEGPMVPNTAVPLIWERMVFLSMNFDQKFGTRKAVPAGHRKSGGHLDLSVAYTTYIYIYIYLEKKLQHSHYHPILPYSIILPAFV